jgi:hypothetical protein
MNIVRSLGLLLAAATALCLGSCCCTSQTQAAPLRKMPNFQPLPAAHDVAPEVAPEVIYTK